MPTLSQKSRSFSITRLCLIEFRLNGQELSDCLILNVNIR